MSAVQRLRDGELAEVARRARSRRRSRPRAARRRRASGRSRPRTAGCRRRARRSPRPPPPAGPARARRAARASTASSSGSRSSARKCRLPAPQSGRVSSSSGRARVTIRIGTFAAPLEQVVDEVEQARVGAVEVLEHQHHGARAGEPLEERAPRREQLRRAAGRRLADAEQRQQRRLDPAPLGLVGDVLGDDLGDLARASSPRRRSRAGRHAPRTISPSAQKVMPSPYGGRAALVPPDRARRGRRCTSGTPRRGGSCRCRPGPMTDTSRDPPLARRRVEQVLEQPQLVVAADERRLEALVAAAPAALGDDAQRPPGRRRAPPCP